MEEISSFGALLSANGVRRRHLQWGSGGSGGGSVQVSTGGTGGMGPMEAAEAVLIHSKVAMEVYMEAAEAVEPEL